MKLNSSAFPQPSQCDNKWCQGPSQIPATGENPQIAKCNSLQKMNYEQLVTGGVTGRGVTPCPFGYLENVSGLKYNNELGVQDKHLIPYEGKNFDTYGPSSIFFDPNRPGYLPPQGYPRPLIKIGNVWRN